ncbi:CHASE domain-containing protein [uncultured Marinobacter sp.]|uniref:CHASE domain-containing protein n=1 Tax=uncultured Marinobacter sp. TaxID=187379 RepID=UPI0030D8CDAF
MESETLSGRLSLLIGLPLLVLALGLALTSLISIPARGLTAAQASELSVAHHQALYEYLNRRLDQLLADTRQLAGELSADRPNLAAITDQLLQRHPEITGLEYLVTVADSQRPLMERQLSLEAGQFIRFGHWRQGPIEPRPSYLVVRQVSFQSGTTDPGTTLGLVADTVPHWRNSLQSALSEGRPAATTLTSIFRNGGEQQALRIFIPTGDRTLLSLVMEPRRWLSRQLDGVHDDRWQLAIHDTSQHARHPLFTLPALGPVEDASAVRSVFSLADRQWMLTTVPSMTWQQQLTRAAIMPVWLLGAVLSLAAAALCTALVWQRQSLQQRLQEQHVLNGQRQRQLENTRVEKSILHKSLADSDDRSRDLIELYGGIVSELDDQYRIGYISPQAATLLGWPVPDLLESSLARLVTGTDQPRLNETLTTARQEPGIHRIDIELITAQQQPLPVTLRVKALKNPLSGCTGFRVSMIPR